MYANTNALQYSDVIAAQRENRRTADHTLQSAQIQKGQIRSTKHTIATDAINARKARYTVYERCLLDVNMHAYKGNMRYKQVQKQKKQANGQSDYQVSLQALNMYATYSKASVNRRRSYIFAIRKCVRQLHNTKQKNIIQFSKLPSTHSISRLTTLHVMKNTTVRHTLYNVRTIQRQPNSILRHSKCLFS
jgi:hypothetical protein